MILYTSSVRQELKPVEWLGDSRDRVRSFAKPVRQQLGYELEMIQHGLEPSDWKPVHTAGPGVMEIRIHWGGEYRVLYVSKFRSAIYVLHAFRKKRPRTAKNDIVIAKTRFQEALRMEASRK